MRILITNDDGIHAQGLASLEKIARELSDDVWIIAPETDQSGVAHSLTLTEPLRLREVAPRHYALKGTPTDCVIMGIRHLLKDKAPDVILSGVNRGQNLADDVTYSGTIAGAMEGTLLGVRSIAVSQAYTYGERHAIRYETAETHAAAVIKKLLALTWPAGTLMNLNFPDVLPDAVRGLKLTRQGKRAQELLDVDERHDGRGFPYFWLAFRKRDYDVVEGTDLAAIDDGYISLTPLQLDLTDYKAFAQLKDEMEK